MQFLQLPVGQRLNSLPFLSKSLFIGPMVKSISVSTIPPHHSSLCRWLRLNGRLRSPVLAQKDRALAFKDSKPAEAQQVGGSSPPPLQAVLRGAKVQSAKMHRRDVCSTELNMFSCVMLKVPTEVSEAGQLPASPTSWRTVAKREASNYIIPSLKWIFSTL